MTSGHCARCHVRSVPWPHTELGSVPSLLYNSSREIRCSSISISCLRLSSSLFLFFFFFFLSFRLTPALGLTSYWARCWKKNNIMKVSCPSIVTGFVVKKPVIINTEGERERAKRFKASQTKLWAEIINIDFNSLSPVLFTVESRRQLSAGSQKASWNWFLR